MVKNYHRQNKISLSQTQWITEKNEMFFIQGASKSLTRREDAKKAIEDNLPKNKPLGLYPKRHIIYNGEKRNPFRALFIDVLKEDRDQQLQEIATAFRKKDPRLAGLNLVPINPTAIVPIQTIKQLARVQNTHCRALSFTTVPGIISLDTSTTTVEGTLQTLRQHFATIKLVAAEDGS